MAQQVVVEHLEAEQGADLGAGLGHRADRLVEQLAAVDHGVAAGGVQRAEQQRAGAGRADQLQCRAPRRARRSRLPAPGPRCSMADWVRLPTSLWVPDSTRSAPAAMACSGRASWKAKCEPQASSTISGHAPAVRDLGQPADVGHGAVVGGRDHDHRGCARGVGQRDLERPGGQAVGDAELGVQLGRDPDRAQAGQDQAVDGAGVHVALDDHLVADAGQRQADGVVALRRAVGQEPGALRAPGVGGQLARLLDRRRAGADVDPGHDQGDVQLQRALAPGRRAGPASAPFRPCARARGSGRARDRRTRAVHRGRARGSDRGRASDRRRAPRPRAARTSAHAASEARSEVGMQCLSGSRAQSLSSARQVGRPGALKDSAPAARYDL